MRFASFRIVSYYKIRQSKVLLGPLLATANVFNHRFSQFSSYTMRLNVDVQRVLTDVRRLAGSNKHFDKPKHGKYFAHQEKYSYLAYMFRMILWAYFRSRSPQHGRNRCRILLGFCCEAFVDLTLSSEHNVVHVYCVMI